MKTRLKLLYRVTELLFDKNAQAEKLSQKCTRSYGEQDLKVVFFTFWN